MRDPELVYRAQLAASALERAWRNWRDVHGSSGGALPVVSSYVGYSLEEPMGQPRVVFGLAAEDAEQLAQLLDRHDCVGPVHALVNARPGEWELAGDRASADWPLPVPAQPAAPATEELYGPSRNSARNGWPLRAGHGSPDGPLYREVAAALQVAVADPPGHGAGGYYPGFGGGMPGEGMIPGPRRGDDQLDGQDAVHYQSRARDAVQAERDLGPRGDRRQGPLPSGGRGHQDADDADGEEGGEPGPLALAASTARAEAETRIKAAGRDTRMTTEVDVADDPYDYFDVITPEPASRSRARRSSVRRRTRPGAGAPDRTDSEDAASGLGHARPGQADDGAVRAAGSDAESLGSVPPDTLPPGAVPPDAAMSDPVTSDPVPPDAATPGSQAPASNAPGSRRPGSQDLDSGQDAPDADDEGAGQSADDSDSLPGQGYGKRSRMTRSPAARQPKARRSGATPGS
jgi:hypothetical protein